MSADLGYFTMSLGDLDRGKAFFGALFDWKFEEEPAEWTHRYAHVDGSNPPFERDRRVRGVPRRPGDALSLWQPAPEYS